MSDTQSGDSATIELPDPQPRDGLYSRLQALRDFFDLHPVLPAPTSCSFTEHATNVSVYTTSRAELDALAGYFGQRPPKDASNYDGAQFYVKSAGLFVTVGFHADMFR